jgi:hypothetical protein
MKQKYFDDVDALLTCIREKISPQGAPIEIFSVRLNFEFVVNVFLATDFCVGSDDTRTVGQSNNSIRMPKGTKMLVVQSWRNSEAKRLLSEDLIKCRIPLSNEEMDAKEVYLQRPEFSQFQFENFRDRLRDLRKQMIACKHQASLDNDSLARDEKMLNREEKKHNQNGEPRWEGSEAEHLLRADMDSNQHKIMRPKELYSTRKEYYETFSLAVFRKHIDQEERRRKFLAQYQSKKKRKKNI